MAQHTNTTPLGRRLLGLMRIAIATDGDQGLAAISHRLPIALPGRNVPMTFTVHLAPDDKGTFLVTCRELPDLTTFGRDEEEALEMAEESIREAIAARQGSSDLPY